jgi:hypothetical protein
MDCLRVTPKKSVKSSVLPIFYVKKTDSNGSSLHPQTRAQLTSGNLPRSQIADFHFVQQPDGGQSDPAIVGGLFDIIIRTLFLGVFWGVPLAPCRLSPIWPSGRVPSVPSLAQIHHLCRWNAPPGVATPPLPANMACPISACCMRRPTSN